MNKKEHLLVVLSEECTEILQDIFDDKSFEAEGNDLVGVALMLQDEEHIDVSIEEINSSDYLSLTKDKKILEFQKELTKLQYYISKSLRFGLNDYHPLEKIQNKDNLEKYLDRVISCLAFIFNESGNFGNNEDIVNKQIKVNKFMRCARDSGCLVD